MSLVSSTQILHPVIDQSIILIVQLSTINWSISSFSMSLSPPLRSPPHWYNQSINPSLQQAQSTDQSPSSLCHSLLHSDPQYCCSISSFSMSLPPLRSHPPHCCYQSNLVCNKHNHLINFQLLMSIASSTQIPCPGVHPSINPSLQQAQSTDQSPPFQCQCLLHSDPQYFR